MDNKEKLKQSTQLSRIDLTMGLLCMDLMKCIEGDLKYKKIVSELAKQYQIFRTLLALYEDEINYTYFIKYSDINYIENLLTKNGYLEDPKKPANR